MSKDGREVDSKKALSLPASTRWSWVKPHADYSIRRRCRLAGVTRSGFYYEPVPEPAENLHLMRLIDEQYLRHPEFGYPRMTDWLREHGYKVNLNRVARLVQQMGLQVLPPDRTRVNRLRETRFSRIC